MIGQLKHRAKVEQMQKQSNGRGGWTEYPQDLGEIWVAQYGISEAQRVEYRKAGMETEQKFIIRFRENIDQHTRLSINGRRYKVESVDKPVDRTGYMTLYCSAE